MKDNLFVKISEEERDYELMKYNNIDRGTLVEIHIADIHFGVFDAKLQYELLENQFINKIKDIDFDLISIDGDLFDHKYMSNSEVVMYASLFIDRLVNLCRIKNATLIIIHGTYYHDAGQLKLFYHYLQDTSVDVRIVEEVKFEFVKNAKILCIPELYGKPKEYYERFLYNNGVYDTAFVHGTFRGSIHGSEQGTLNSDRYPIFDINNFKNCLGPILSGHFHVSSCFKQYYHYCGSPYRWQFGEEETKGFLVVLHNLDNHKHYVKLEPIISTTYNTFDLSDMLKNDVHSIIEHIENLLLYSDFIRIKFLNVKTEEERNNVTVIRQYYRTNNRVKFMLDNDNANKQILKENKEALEKYKEYDYILNKNLSSKEILIRYINQREGKQCMTVEDLDNILSDDV